MNKKQLIEYVSEYVSVIADITKVDATLAIDAIIGAIQSSLKKGGRVVLVGFGTFSVAKRKARKGRNPKNGQAVDIPAKKVVKFKTGLDLHNAINK